MSKRSNLPYTTQDLFPTIGPGSSASFTGPGSGSRSGSISGMSNGSGGFTPRGPFTPTPNIWSGSSIQNFKKMFKRIIKPRTLDFETAMWEIGTLIINPKKMYRSQYYYKQYQSNKTSYTRDDPSFLILLTIFLSVSATAWGLAYSPGVFDILKLILYSVVVDFYLTGMIISTISWLITNRVFNNTWGVNKYSVNYIEWGFCFDIHCNSFVIIWCFLYLLQFVLLPFISIKDSFISLFVGNSLYFVSIGHYFVITFYGFNSLPFSNERPSKILQMIIIGGVLPVLAILWIVSLGLGINVAYRMIDSYFN